MGISYIEMNGQKIPIEDEELRGVVPTMEEDINDCVRTLGYTKSYNELENKATTTTINGLTFTVNSDKSVTVNGTATADTFLNLNYDGTNVFDDGDYIASGGHNDVWLEVITSNNVFVRDKGENVEFTIENTSNNWARLFVDGGTVVDNVTVYPMVRPSHIEDDTYIPYEEDVQIRVNRLYDVEQVKVDKVIDVGTEKTTIHSFTINRKAIVSISCCHHHNAVRPTYIGMEINGYELVGCSNTNDGSISVSYSCLVEPGRTFNVVTQASGSGKNTVSVWGYIQYLE